jgi:hypothetical protein
MSVKTTRVIVVALLLAGLSAQARADYTGSDPWKFRLSLYGWAPDISGEATLHALNSDLSVSVAPNEYLPHLNSVFKGAFEVRKGRWGAFTDLVYMDLAKEVAQSRDITFGGLPLPVSANANVDYALQSTIWSLAGIYNTVHSSEWELDALLGFRYIDLRQDVTWNISGDMGDTALFGRSGEAAGRLSNLDGIIGLRGRYAFGEQHRWFMPFYLDVGTGDSKLTTQIAAGLGYAFDWGEISANWRNLHYEMPSGMSVRDMDFNGPSLDFTLSW